MNFFVLKIINTQYEIITSANIIISPSHIKLSKFSLNWLLLIIFLSRQTFRCNFYGINSHGCQKIKHSLYFGTLSQNN